MRNDYNKNINKGLITLIMKFEDNNNQHLYGRRTNYSIFIKILYYHINFSIFANQICEGYYGYYFWQ